MPRIKWANSTTCLGLALLPISTWSELVGKCPFSLPVSLDFSLPTRQSLPMEISLPAAIRLFAFPGVCGNPGTVRAILFWAVAWRTKDPTSSMAPMGALRDKRNPQRPLTWISEIKDSIPIAAILQGWVSSSFKANPPRELQGFRASYPANSMGKNGKCRVWPADSTNWCLISIRRSIIGVCCQLGNQGGKARFWTIADRLVLGYLLSLKRCFQVQGADSQVSFARIRFGHCIG